MNKQLALAIQLNDEATFNDFCWGENDLLRKEVIRMLEGSGERYLMLWGAVGSGKSHLLQACCQALSSEQSSIYLPLKVLKEWGPDSIDAIEQQNLIAIDDIDVIAGDAAWEEALFHLYNKARAQEDTKLIISSSQSPASARINLPDLKSRLSWGLVVQLYELNDDLKIQTLQQHAQKRGFELPTGVGQFLINRCARNMSDLHQILDQLDNASLAAQRKITIPFAKTILNI
ncbi:DnaA regulatory inactivator Hda [Legionella jordanis]|uniref:ATPase regulatory factor involved in DnaA inactivation n=1 Tax=Legionella jordanis TaxID=456 RepID=A0A0W0VDB5_9GAMM|nr:DnaA regulatory inactivator Hda [Legionella jordanis]KTD18114.1 ATPase regulatory factor involved in DnaA inactivation [Legionella jordanis]RMX00575.1 DnaA regulatory inactivator Hda [Legionella jordanis]RMX21309.1 DnaA regulatory inactivator Hda [Legionella jordanis]VEH13793.1 ATPase regulatory factor involved in DnaA inactivation [Legionella jordanis]HAT8714176.1 DnaA regulatory inactivator Hda [Legionella jordanis]